MSSPFSRDPTRPGPAVGNALTGDIAQQTTAAGQPPKAGDVMMRFKDGWKFEHVEFGRAAVPIPPYGAAIPTHIARVVNVADDDIWIDGDFTGSLERAIEAVSDKDPANPMAWGEVRIPPGVWTLTREINVRQRNLIISGYGGMGDEGVSGVPGTFYGGGMTQIIAPVGANKWAFKSDNGGAMNHSGCWFRHIHIIGNSSAGAGGFWIKDFSNARIIDCTSGDFLNGTDLKIGFAATTSQYNVVERFKAYGSKTAFDLQNGEATFIHCHASGNNSNQRATMAGSMGMKQVEANVRSYSLTIQGYDTLMYNTDGICSNHYGLYLEDFITYALRVGAGSANPGAQYFINSINNFLGGGGGTGIKLEAGCQHTLVICHHIQGVAVLRNDASGNDTNDAWLRHQLFLGRWNINNSGGIRADVWNDLYLQGNFGVNSFTGSAPGGSQIDKFPIYDGAHNLVGYVPVYDS